MDASNKQETISEKFVRAWEKKNAKAARAGGVSLMALSLAACGGSSSTTTTTDTSSDDTTTTPVVDAAKTIALTSNQDTAEGGSGDDAFSGVVQAAGATGTTAFPGDVVNGGAGNDTLTISVAGDAGGAYTISALDVNNVETVQLANFDTNAGDTTVDTALMDGATTFGLSSSSATGDTIFDNIAAITQAKMANGAGDLTFTYNATVVTGTADAQVLNVSNLSAGTFTANGTENLTINSSLAKSTLTAAASDALKKVTITGDQDLKITTALDFAGNGTATAPGAVIDASAFTGKLTVGTTASENLSLTSGSGDDTFTLGSLVKTDVVDGGAGDDTIKMAAGTFTTQFAKVTNVENIIFNDSGAAVSIAADKIADSIQNITVTLKDDATGADNLASAVTGLAGEKVIITRADEDADVDGQVDVQLTNATDTAADTATVELKAVGTNGDEAADTDGDEYGMGILDVANYETVNLTSTKSTSITANQMMTLNASSTTGVTVTGDADLTIDAVSGGKMTSFDASGLAAKLTATFAGDKVAVTGGQKDSTINFGSTLNNDDSVTGGAGTADTVTATVTGLTATTGALSIGGVEKINLTTSGNNTIDAAGITGASTVLAVTDNVQTITNFDLAQTIQLGLAGDESATSSEIDVTAADATGAADTLKVKIENTNGAATSIIDASAIETLDLEVIAAGNGATLDLTTFEGDNVNIASKAGVTATAALALGTLHKNTESVTSTYADKVTVSFANATNAATFSGAGTDVQNVTGSAKGDTITIGSTGAITHVVSGGAGTDTTNLTAKTGLVNVGSIDTENVNVTVAAGNDITLSTSFGTGVDNIVLTGGNSLSTFTTGAIVTEVKLVDASAFLGNVVVDLVKNTADDTVTLKGGALATDELNYQIDATGTDSLYSSGIEILDLDIDETSTLSLANASGVLTVDVDLGVNAAAKTFTVDKVTTETILLTAADDQTADHTLEAKLTDATGSADALTFKIGAGTIDAGVLLKTTDIENVTINADNAATVSLANLSMATADKVMTLTVTGDSALTVSALNADVTTIDASGMTTGGSVVQTARSATAASTYTGSAGNDTFIMSNAADAIAGGAGTGDTLDINLIGTLGAIAVDLSATGDQVTTANGIANAAVQSGFENVDLSGYTISGALVTGSSAANVITVTEQLDQVDAGAGNDTVKGTEAALVTDNDNITMGAGTDTIEFTDNASVDTTNWTGLQDAVETWVFAADAGADAVVIKQAQLATTATITLKSAADGDDDTFKLVDISTVFEAAAEANAAAVNIAGEWHLDNSGSDGVLTYYNEASSEVSTITFTGLDAGAVAIANGDITWTA